MSNKATFTAEEWKSITEAPMLAGTGVMKADFGLISAAKEFKSLIQNMGAAKEKYPNNELIRSVLTEIETSSNNQQGEQPKMELEDIVSKVKVAADTVNQKAAGESADYKNFIFNLASAAATAGGTGFFSSTAKVSDAENQYLGKLKSALGL
jgi:hypothetical protein